MINSAVVGQFIGIISQSGSSALPATFKAIAVGTGNWYRCVDDIVNGWIQISTKPFAGAVGAAYSGLLHRFVVADFTSAKIATSDDGGATWTNRTITKTVNHVLWIPALSVFVAVGLNCCFTSPDGITWTEQTIPALAYNSACYSPDVAGGRIVAVGGNAGAYSDDGGVTWISFAATAASNLIGVIWSANNSLFIAGSRSGAAVITSPDGITWTQRATGKQTNWPVQNTIDDKLDMSPQDTLLGYQSTDGITWTGGRMPNGSVPKIDWCRDRETYLLAAFGVGVLYGAYNAVTWSSVNASGLPVTGDFYGFAFTDSVDNPEGP